MACPSTPELARPRHILLSESHAERHGCAGLTVVEALIIAAILVTLAAIAFPAYSKYMENTRIAQAVSDLHTLEHDILIQEGYSGKLPASLDEIGKGNLRGPWGNPYRYLNIATAKSKGALRKDHDLNPLNADFDLYSVGRDGNTKAQINNKVSLDDVVRALNGAYIGLASEF